MQQVWEVGRRPVNLNTSVLQARFSAWLLPLRCLACGEAGADGRDLCAACARELPWNTTACARCAAPLGAPSAVCGACLSHPPAQSATRAVLRYEGAVDGLVRRFKFHANLACGALLSQLMIASVKAVAADLIVPVPLHRARLGQRGYNQALELAKPLAAAWRVPLAMRALQRLRPTAPQSELDAAQRRRNVRGAFVANAPVVRGRRVLLVDDVITTGSTASEAARTLLAAGAGDVQVLAAARVA